MSVGTLEEKKEMSNEEVKETPKMGDEDWTDYVMSLLRPSEIDESGSPKAAGVFRVGRLLVGEVDHDLSVHSATPEYAAVTAVITRVDFNIRYVGSAEVISIPEHPHRNTDLPYAKFPLASAETRALARAYKRMLELDVLISEETSEEANLRTISTDDNRTEGSITSSQIRFIENICKNIGVNLEKAVKSIVGEHEFINDLSHAEAVTVNKTLDEWSKNSAENKEHVTECGSFNSNWKASFFLRGE